MEIFVFPELMYSIVLANIMSPIIWKWRDADCFKRLEGKSPYKKLMRLKQFIMDEYEFNLDLNTWGLTNKDEEIKRFEHVISAEKIAESNALFGYTGDKYYFDVDIRRHLDLDSAHDCDCVHLCYAVEQVRVTKVEVDSAHDGQGVDGLRRIPMTGSRRAAHQGEHEVRMGQRRKWRTHFDRRDTHSGFFAVLAYGWLRTR